MEVRVAAHRDPLEPLKQLAHKLFGEARLAARRCTQLQLTNTLSQVHAAV